MANEFLTDEHTSVLAKLVNEVVNDPSTYYGSKLIPSVSMPASRIRAEIIEASGGLTREHTTGTDVKYVEQFSTRVQEFAPGDWREAHHFGEKQILDLRELGQNDPSKRGIRQYIDKATDKLNRRLEARIEKLRWDSIFTGSWSWNGAVISYGIPAANQTSPIGAAWSTDGVNANNAANPVADIRYWVTGGLARFRKYKVKQLVMNGNTARWIIENSNTKAYIASIGGNANIAEWNLDRIMDFFIPGGPKVMVYNGWYQPETVDSAGKVSVGDAQYFIPDGYIFFEVDLPGGDKVGEFVQGIHLAGGSIDQPGYGKFLVIDDHTAPGTKGGPGNPYFDIIAGVRGGTNLYRSFDVLTAKVVP